MIESEEKKNVFVFTHPLIKHKISILRDINTGTSEFRKIVGEIAMLEGYEALSDLPLEDVEVETPIIKCKTPKVSGKKLCMVPVLRAGLGMLEGMLSLVPTAKVGHVGLYRDEKTKEPHTYYCKLPKPIELRTIAVLDPMLATGGSLCAAVEHIKKAGGKKIKVISIIAAPEGIERLMREHPDIQLYVGTVDEGLNEDAFIVPGLGDCGDRIYGTK